MLVLDGLTWTFRLLGALNKTSGEVVRFCSFRRGIQELLTLSVDFSWQIPYTFAVVQKEKHPVIKQLDIEQLNSPRRRRSRRPQNREVMLGFLRWA